MSKIKVVEYKAANGGDYDTYKLSNGVHYYLWLKNPFYSSNQAHVHVMTNDDKEIGDFVLIKDIDQVSIFYNGKKAVVPITINQYLKPNKKYFFDKIIKQLVNQ